MIETLIIADDLSSLRPPNTGWADTAVACT
jgi:hypothetical protein